MHHAPSSHIHEHAFPHAAPLCHHLAINEPSKCTKVASLTSQQHNHKLYSPREMEQRVPTNIAGLHKIRTTLWRNHAKTLQNATATARTISNAYLNRKATMKSERKP